MESDNKRADKPNPPSPEAQDDAQQFFAWIKDYGRPALIGLALVVMLMLGVSIWRNQQAEKARAAVEALFLGRAPEEFQQLALADPKAPTAPLAQATAAAEFYAQGRYDEALSAYQRFLSLYPGHMMAPNAEVGVAASLEALDDFDGAARAYQAFAESNPGHMLAPQSVMGAARCREQLGQLEEARALYEDFMVANPDSPWMAQAESGLLFLKMTERARAAGAKPAGEPAEDARVPPVVFDSSTDAMVLDEGEPAEAAKAVEADTPKKTASKKKKASKPEDAEAVSEAPAVEAEAAAAETEKPKRKRRKKAESAD